MADQEVSIRITSKADLAAITEAQRKIADLNKAAASYDQKGMGDAATSARREALARSKALEPQLQAAGQKEVAAAVAAEAEQLKLALDLQKQLGGSFAEAADVAKGQISSQAALNAEKAAELAAERQITREEKEQAALAKAGAGEGGGGSAGGGGSSLLSLRRVSAAALATALAGIVDEALTEISERQGMANRDVAQRNMSDYRLQRQSGLLGSSSEIFSESRATQERIEDRKQKRAELEREAKYGPMQGGIRGAAAGGAAGAALGSVVPIVGTAIGAAVGAGIGGLYGYETSRMKGQRTLDEDTQAQQRDRDLLAKQQAAAQKKFDSGEGGLELKIAEDTSKHSIGGMRDKRKDEDTLEYLREYRRLMEEGASETERAEGASLKTSETQRERAMHAADGLITARSGMDDVAAAASLTQSLMNNADTSRAIDAMHATLKTQFTQLNGTTAREEFH